MLGLFFGLEGGDMFLQNVCRLSTAYVAVIFQEAELFISTVVRTSYSLI
jgi:hypothetical protein